MNIKPMLDVIAVAPEQLCVYKRLIIHDENTCSAPNLFNAQRRPLRTAEKPRHICTFLWSSARVAIFAHPCKFSRAAGTSVGPTPTSPAHVPRRDMQLAIYSSAIYQWLRDLLPVDEGGAGVTNTAEGMTAKESCGSVGLVSSTERTRKAPPQTESRCRILSAAVMARSRAGRAHDQE